MNTLFVKNKIGFSISQTCESLSLRSDDRENAVRSTVVRTCTVWCMVRIMRHVTVSHKPKIICLLETVLLQLRQLCKVIQLLLLFCMLISV